MNEILKFDNHKNNNKNERAYLFQQKFDTLIFIWSAL